MVFFPLLKYQIHHGVNKVGAAKDAAKRVDDLVCLAICEITGKKEDREGEKKLLPTTAW